MGNLRFFVIEHESLTYAKILIKIIDGIIFENRSEIKNLQEVIVTPDCI